jgi:hypothetical protein
VILFFPVNIDNCYTCLFHQKFAEKNIVNLGDEPAVNSAEKVNIKNNNRNENVAHSQLLHYYLKDYALVWWSSLAILVLIISYLKKTIIKLKTIA